MDSVTKGLDQSSGWQLGDRGLEPYRKTGALENTRADIVGEMGV
jgi:hypothetical protein